jgi:hypothetical protein
MTTLELNLYLQIKRETPAQSKPLNWLLHHPGLKLPLQAMLTFGSVLYGKLNTTSNGGSAPTVATLLREEYPSQRTGQTPEQRESQKNLLNSKDPTHFARAMTQRPRKPLPMVSRCLSPQRMAPLWPSTMARKAMHLCSSMPWVKWSWGNDFPTV